MNEEERAVLYDCATVQALLRTDKELQSLTIDYLIDNKDVEAPDRIIHEALASVEEYMRRRFVQDNEQLFREYVRTALDGILNGKE